MVIECREEKDILLLLFLRTGAFRVDHVGERPLEAQSDDIYDVYIQRDEQASRTFVPQRGRSEAHRAAHVHGVSQDVERESLDAVVHQDPKVVPEERPGDTEGPGRGHDEYLADSEHDDWHHGRKRPGEEGNTRLVSQCEVV